MDTLIYQDPHNNDYAIISPTTLADLHLIHWMPLSLFDPDKDAPGKYISMRHTTLLARLNEAKERVDQQTKYIDVGIEILTEKLNLE